MSQNNNNNKKSNNNNAQNKRPNRNPFLNKNRKRVIVYKYIRPNKNPPNIKRNEINKIIKRHKTQVRDYIKSLLFPEDALSGFVAKQPSYISLPTANVVFKEQLNFQIGNDRKFYLMWIPNFFATKPSLQHDIEEPGEGKKLFYSHLYYKTAGFELDDSEVFWCHTCYLPEISLSKYRLVSAKISVQYNGTIMNQSGQMYSCATYDDLPVISGACEAHEEDVTLKFDGYLEDTNIKLSSYFDIEKVRNGLWPKFCNITSTTGQIDNIALPTDPTDHTFYPMNHYYQVEPLNLVQLDRITAGDAVRYAISTDGGHLSYLYNGFGIPEGTNITVVVYYNFEVIPTQTTAPFLRTTKNDPKLYNFIQSKFDVITDKIAEVNSTTNKLTGTSQSPNKNLGGLIRNIMSAIFTGAATTGPFMLKGSTKWDGLI